MRGEAEMNEFIPEHMHNVLKLYIERGVPPGSFMSAVICNDLSGAMGRADHINQHRIFDIVKWFYNYAPIDCWGNEDKYHGWLERGGLEGKK